MPSIRILSRICTFFSAFCQINLSHLKHDVKRGVFNCITVLFLSLQSADSQTQINGNRALEIVQINAAVFFDFLKAVDGVSSTAEPGFPGRSMIVAPEILVRGLSVAGD